MTRQQRYSYLSSQIASKDNEYFLAFFTLQERGGRLGGEKQVLEIDGHKVFVKRIPLTQKEYESKFSTKNLYNLPLCYHYGVGSAGFGAYRELVVNIKTTNWVLSGETENFPLLYHYRVLPFVGEHEPIDQAQQDGYIAYWGGNENIRTYINARTQATHELVLFLEYVPHILQDWLNEKPSATSGVMEELRETIDFLRHKEILHFDAHYHNILTDGERVYLADFGLVLDRNAELTDAERDFFDAHTHFDYGEVLMCLADVHLHTTYEALPESEKQKLREQYALSEEMDWVERESFLLAHFRELQDNGVLHLDATYFALLTKYHSVTLLMKKFFLEMHFNQQKDTSFPNETLKQLLGTTGFIEIREKL
jgi:serine/threonine protein kinase